MTVTPDTASSRAALVYNRLPETYRAYDETFPGYPLLNYLDLLLAPVARIDVILDRLDRAPGDLDPAASDLVDPAAADASWLPWLAQVLGVPLAGLTIEEQRAALADLDAAHAHGSRAALRRATAEGLTGTKTVEVTPHYNGSPWHIGLGTLDAETDTVETWAEFMARYPSWASIQAQGSWGALLHPAINYALKERPAGYVLVRYSLG